MKQLSTLWHRVAVFFEDGDLTPLAVLISVAHYGDVLAKHEGGAVVAYAIGALVDLIHFRTVRKAFMPHGSKAETAVNWFLAIITTAMASMYHHRFYEGDLLLALPIPVGIAILAYHAADTRTKQASSEHLQASIESMQDEAATLRTAVKELQTKNATLQGVVKGQEQIVKRWQHLGENGQTIVKAIAGEITVNEAIEQTSLDPRTVKAYMVNMNGAAK